VPGSPAAFPISAFSFANALISRLPYFNI